eukprot:m.144425 g.144425  ORF g.144425 m.144425 type:complete len:859 (+) comp16196_c0_seq3:154-2730(+)
MFSLQKRVFDQASERLVAVLQVKKPKKKEKKDKKGKKTYLCLALTNNNLPQLHQVRVVDESHQRRHSWDLSNLAVVECMLDDDGRSSTKFVLEFEKSYEWVAPSVPEAQTFVASLQKLAQRFCKQEIQYLNINPDPEGQSSRQSQAQTADTSLVGSDLGEEESTAMTSIEEAQAQAILSSYNWSSGFVNTLTTQLEGELDAREAANIHALLESESAVANVIRLLDSTVVALDQVDDALNEYVDLVKPLRHDAARVAEQEAMLRVQATNNAKLKAELHDILPLIEFPDTKLRILERCDTKTTSARDEAQDTIRELTDHLNTGIKDGWQHMAVVQGAVRQYLQAEDTFATRLVQQLEALIERQETLGGRLMESSTTEQAMYHERRHEELAPYTGLLQWLQQHQQDSDVSQFDSLARSYSSRMAQVYSVHIQALCEGTKGMMVSKKQTKGETDNRQRRVDFSETFKRLLRSLMQLVQQEEDFCQALFGLDILNADKAADKHDTRDTSAEVNGEMATVDIADTLKHRLREVPSLLKANPQAVLSPLGARLSKDEMLATLFSGLDSAVAGLIEYCCQNDAFHATSMTLQLDEQVGTVPDSAGFLKRLLSHCLVLAKRQHNTFVSEQATSIKETKYKRSQVAGILPFIPELEVLVKDTEAVVQDGAHRLVVDKAYQQWMSAIFEAIYVVAEEAKHPNVLLFENLRRIYDLTSSLKIDAIKEWRRQAQVKYREHLQAYVESILGRPMEQLSAFFEGVETELAQGTSVQEVAYKFDYNKQKLRDVLKLYQGKEVKRGLEGTFKRVCRHLSDEDLVDVVWRSIQEEFIKQYQRFEQLIDQCYGQGFKLAFGADDVLQFFSEIAQEFH